MNRRNSLKVGASVFAGLTVASMANAAGTSIVESSSNSFWEIMKNRRSVRAFKSDPVPMEDIHKIIDAARMAPTAGNQQPWKFLVINDKEKINALKKEALKQAEVYFRDSKKLAGEELKEQLTKNEERLTNGYLSAPTLIVVLTDNNSRYPDYNHWDGPLAAGYMMLAARAMGYGTVFITDSFSEEMTKKVFNIPDQYSRVCITPLGVPLEWPEKEKKPLDNFIINDGF